MHSDDAAQILSGSQYEVVDGGGEGPVVALAHGAGGGVRENFAPLIDGIGDRRFVGPYWPGSGDTPRSDTPLELDALADAVVAAAVSSGADRFPVVGLSLGAAVAVTAARRHPEHVSGLVLTVGVARADVRVRAATGTFRALAAAGAPELAAYVLRACSTDEQLRDLSPEDAERIVADVRAAIPPGAPEQMELVGRVDVTGLLSGISVPTLVVVGGGDRLIPPDIERELGTIRGARVIAYDGAGHTFTPREAAVWAADVAEFLRTLP
ncbi:alpha/beta hydrolase [Tsukamurella sp. NPDC003166]|uniref:alpha/beta fold hydrolase n=1 Tax=Tsukamurella sp. NPDC003166 TaxID=3154444 RepID=UPI0033B2AC7D